jgi:iron complex transport system substrate-binding protein
MRRYTLKPLIFLASAAVLLLSACAPQNSQPPLPPTPAPIVLEDGLGRSVTLDGPAQRVVSIAPSNTEILFALSAGEQVVGRDEFSDYPAEAASLPTVGGSFGGYSYETIVSLEPDLVLAAEINTPEQVQALEDLGITVYYLSNPADFEGIFRNLDIVGRLVGRESEAAALSASLSQRVAAVSERAAGITDRPSVFYELDSTDPSAPFTAGGGTFIDLLITMAGGTNAAGSITTPWAQVSIEELLLINPEVILLGDAAYGVTVESVGQRPGWEAISAVANGRVYPFDDNLASRPGPRMVDGLEDMFRLLHPDR